MFFNFYKFACFLCIASRPCKFLKPHLGPFLAFLHAYLPIRIAFSHASLHQHSCMHQTCFAPMQGYFAHRTLQFSKITLRSLHCISTCICTPISVNIASLHSFKHPQHFCIHTPCSTHPQGLFILRSLPFLALELSDLKPE